MIVRGGVWIGLALLGSRCSFSADLNHFIRFALLCVAHTVQTENQTAIVNDGFAAYKNITNNSPRST